MDRLWGSGNDLDALQMAVRAVVLFAIALVLIRLSGRRSFGRHTAFDNIIVIMLGAILSRPVYGASPFWPIVAASGAIVALHRVIGVAKSRWSLVERLVAGRVDVLWRAGRLDTAKMTRHEISVSDLDAAARAAVHVESHEGVPEIRIETSGELTVVDHS